MLFYQYYAEISTFLVKNCSFHLLPTTLMSKCLAENDVNVTKTASPYAQESSYNQGA